VGSNCFVDCSLSNPTLWQQRLHMHDMLQSSTTSHGRAQYSPISDGAKARGQQARHMAHEPLPHAHMHLEAPDMPRWNPRSRHRDPWGFYIEANLTVSAGGVTVLRILCTVVTVYGGSFYSSREGRPLYRVPTRDSTPDYIQNHSSIDPHSTTIKQPICSSYMPFRAYSIGTIVTQSRKKSPTWAPLILRMSRSRRPLRPKPANVRPSRAERVTADASNAMLQ